ncbi:fungal-specific transcription factor domain-containing protein [Rhodocollybia butyracea]|uniref:Fungal-specific transcription factor domain-containing protein n=1 Tax=Rhodocollybia butyracea TaxID=206335 RepID=A0A9P5UFL2_9AGAR|nr:fungal-specific transcription factor domain-containing protein [Rhodocollybia butyracea]
MSEEIGPRKRLKQQGSCDNCFRRKVRCDDEDSPGNVCSECSAMNLECTRLICASQRKHGPATEYCQGLEQEIASLRVTLSQSSGSISISASSLPSALALPSGTEADDPPPRSEIDLDEALSDRFKGLALDHYQGRHFGRSSHFMLLQTALDSRDALINGEARPISVQMKREAFWQLQPWHVVQESEPIPYDFPPDDLLKILVDLYWEHFHFYYPLLHKPTFERSVFYDKLHLRDRSFGATVLAVCALASRHCDDPRVLYDSKDNEPQSLHSAGWKWFLQIEFVPKSFIKSPSVYALQIYPLAVVFIHATHFAEISWVLISPGIRLAETIGVHRSGFGKGKFARDPVEVELWKRAFWQLIVFDTASSMALGRPRASNANDLDLELPTMCDDEYWPGEPLKPTEDFKQPPQKKSYLTFWIHYIKLMEIVGFAQRSIYPARRLDPWGPTHLSASEWHQRAVMEIDSALNKWLSAVPEHLKYDPHCEDSIFIHQSVMLYAGYYWARIQVHRPFIGQKHSAIPSLAICASSARSCIHLLTGHHRQYNIRLPHLLPPIFTSALVMLINLWRGIRAKRALNIAKEMDDVNMALEMMAMYEGRYDISRIVFELLAN